MIDGRIIRGVDCTNATFRRCLASIKDAALQAEIKAALKELLFCSLDAPPRALHLHQLKGKQVSSAVSTGQKVHVWTIHVTKNDAYKASFTLEDGMAYMRLCDEHDVIDKNP